MEVGTAIATFDSSGNYYAGHAAIFAGCTDDYTIRVSICINPYFVPTLLLVFVIRRHTYWRAGGTIMLNRHKRVIAASCLS